jgi:hypothetical protein
LPRADQVTANGRHLAVANQLPRSCCHNDLVLISRDLLNDVDQRGSEKNNELIANKSLLI